MQRVTERKTTAEMAALARAAGVLDDAARNPDVLARSLIGARLRVALVPGLRSALRLGYEWLIPGLYMFIQARTHVVDEVLKERLPALEQLVILGAGLDSRPYRFARPLATRRVYEVDYPATARHKRASLRRAGIATGHVRYVATDFATETLATVLESAGFETTRRTLFVWEGVTMYLPESAIAATLALVGSCRAGSAIVFDYFYRDAVDVPDAFRGAAGTIAFMNRRGEPCRFGINSDDLPTFLARFGLVLTANHGHDELARLVKLSRTRTLIDFSAIAVAEVR